jgi:hypothetical protein
VVNNRGIVSRIAALPQVHDTALCKKNNMTARWHSVTINLRLDIGYRSGIGLQPSDVDFDVESTITAF